MSRIEVTADTPRALDEVLGDLLVDEEGTPSLRAVATALLHDVVGRVRKDRVNGKITLSLVVEPTKDGVGIEGKVAGTITAGIGAAKAAHEFVAKRYGQLELPFGEE